MYLFGVSLSMGVVSCLADHKEQKKDASSEAAEPSSTGSGSNSLVADSVFIPRKTSDEGPRGDEADSTAELDRSGYLLFSVLVPRGEAVYGLSDSDPAPDSSWAWEAAIAYTTPAGKTYSQAGSLKLENRKGAIALAAVGFGKGTMTLTLLEGGLARYSGKAEVEITANTKTLRIALYPAGANIGVGVDVPPGKEPPAQVGDAPVGWDQRSNVATGTWKIEFLPTN